jgi:hypothetical protein
MPYGKKSAYKKGCFKMEGKSPMIKQMKKQGLKALAAANPELEYVGPMKKYGCKKCKSAMCMCGPRHKK